MNGTHEDGQPPSRSRAESWDACVERIRRKLEKNRRLIEEQKRRPAHRDREGAEVLAEAYLKEGRL